MKKFNDIIILQSRPTMSTMPTTSTMPALPEETTATLKAKINELEKAAAVKDKEIAVLKATINDLAEQVMIAERWMHISELEQSKQNETLIADGILTKRA